MESFEHTSNTGDGTGLEPRTQEGKAGEASRSHTGVGSVLLAEELKEDGEESLLKRGG